MKSIANKLSKSLPLANLMFSILLLGVKMLFWLTAIRFPFFKNRLKEKNLTVQIKLKDNSSGRYFTFQDGKVISKSGIHASPDVTMIFGSNRVAFDTLIPPRDQLAIVNAMKSFQLGLDGPEELSSWWMETLSLMLNAGTKYGTRVSKGVVRYTSNTNGGPVFVYVKDDKIIRITPIEFNDSDAEPWTIKARGRSFTPPRKTTISPHTLVFKSMLYSPDRILYPMKRVDFDPNGERNCQNRGIIRDVTEHKQFEQKLAEMATHDALTGLPNRILLSDRFTVALALSRRSRNRLAVLMLDLDRFKAVNDSMGHDVGDQLLKAAGKRLKVPMRKSDTVARIGGDEFVVLLPQIPHADEAAKVAQRILEAFREPFVFDGHRLYITTSIGIAVYPEGGEDIESLLKNADIAMYGAKEQGRDAYRFYDGSEAVTLLAKQVRA